MPHAYREPRKRRPGTPKDDAPSSSYEGRLRAERDAEEREVAFAASMARLLAERGGHEDLQHRPGPGAQGQGQRANSR